MCTEIAIAPMTHHVGQLGFIGSLDSCFFLNLKGVICVESEGDGIRDVWDLHLMVVPVRLEGTEREDHIPMTIDNVRTMACKLLQILEKQRKS